MIASLISPIAVFLTHCTQYVQILVHPFSSEGTKFQSMVVLTNYHSLVIHSYAFCPNNEHK